MTYAEIICAAIISIGMPNADYACMKVNAVVKDGKIISISKSD